MKFSKSGVCGALLFAVATLMATQSQPAYSATVWNLFDHPDGNSLPPPYGLRLDGIEHFYQNNILTTPTTVIDDNSATWLFSFGQPGTSSTTMTLNDAETTATIQGTLFGGIDQNQAPGNFSGLGSVDLSFTYEVDSVGVVNGLKSLVFGAGAGTLKFNDTIQTILSGSEFNLVSHANSNGFIGQYSADGHRLGTHGCDSFDTPLELCQRQVGFGWLGLLREDGSEFHTTSQDYLYTGSLAVIPLPAAWPLFLTGLAGLGLLRRRSRRA